jgi:translation elongation factor EF-G
MANYRTHVRRGRTFQYEFTASNPKSMTDRQIKNFFKEYGQEWDERVDFAGRPQYIASPINKPREGFEFLRGFSGNLRYHGQRATFVGSEQEWIAGGAVYTNRRVIIDTHYNNVLEEAVKRGIVKISDEGLIFPFKMIDISSNFKRKSLQGARRERLLATRSSPPGNFIF